MADEAVAVLEAPDTAVVDEVVSQESGQSTETDKADGTQRQEQDKQDGRNRPDALRKHIADLKRQAEAIQDPIEKKTALDRIKLLYDTTGKARGYEEVYPTVREAREVRALLDAVGGRDGLQKMQATASEVAQNDQALKAGDPSIVAKMWQEAPEGMPKLVPAIIDRFAKEKPQEYEQFIAPRAVGHLDAAGFPQAFDRMVKLYESGKPEEAKAIRDELIQWVATNRQQAQKQQQADPEVERLRAELAKRDQGAESQAVDTAYNAVVNAAGPVIDIAAKPLVAKLKLTPEEYKVFRGQVWDHLQNSRNADSTYKTIAPAKQKQGYDKWTEYANRWTQDNAETSIRAVLKTPPWSRLVGSGPSVVTKHPGTPVGVVQGKEPSPSEIDYGGKGLQVARKAGFKDIADMILSGQAPLKSGGIRKWR